MSEADAPFTPPPGFRLQGIDGGYIRHNGPIFVCDRDGGDTLIVKATPAHCNNAGSVSGGLTMLLLDVTMGVAISARCGGPHIHCPTIQINTNFLAPTQVGMVLTGSAEITRVTRSVGFLNAVLRAGTITVATASGIYRMPPALTQNPVS